MMPLIFHIPHASTHIPARERSGISLSDADLANELRILTDHATDELFSECVREGDVIIAAPVSRLVVDVERFPVDAEEPMSATGMGAVYLRGHDGRELRASLVERERMMREYYEPHHQALAAAVASHLETAGRAIIIDCHSFPQFTLPYERDRNPDRPQICIGTDRYHTPEALAAAIEHSYQNAGYLVARDTPFAGSLVPLAYYGKEQRVSSVMIELRRDIYMEESSGKIHSDLVRVKAANQAAIAAARRT